MAESSLQDRLREHAEAFDGLLSLIPAKYYYGQDNSDQWKKKKQTKEQAAIARRAKLDPDSAKSAKDVMDERARKRKLEELEELDGSDMEGIDKEQPKQGLKIPRAKQMKKQKLSGDALRVQSPEKQESEKMKVSKQLKHDERRVKREQNQGEKKKRLDEKKMKIQADVAHKSESRVEGALDHKEDPKVQAEDATEANDEDLSGDEIGHFEAEGLDEKPDDQDSSTNSSPPSPTFDNPTEPSANTSTSSVVPPATAPKHIKLPTDPELLRARLAARIEVLRAARKADGPDGAPARNRQELMEARRKKEEQRRAHKRELRLKARAEEDARREAALASARDSPASSLMSPRIHSPEHYFSFGRVTFADGQQLADDLSSLKDAPKRRGPQDAGTALLASEKRRQRIAGFDDEKRADIEEKDLWLNAKKRAHGEKIRDDSSLLKKTLKRKEKQKKKSEKEWGERKDGIAKSQAMKQKKREENLKKRNDEKRSKGKGKKGKGKAAGSKKAKVTSRPGFEGSFGSGKRK